MDTQPQSDLQQPSPQLSSLPPQGKSSAGNRSWLIGLIVLIILVAICAYVFVHKKAPVVVQNPQKITSTFAATPYEKFPKEFLLPGAMIPQYFDNAIATGVTFFIKLSYGDVRGAYIKYLAGTVWQVASTSSPTTSISSSSTLLITNKETGKVARVTLSTPATGITSVVAGFQK